MAPLPSSGRDLRRVIRADIPALARTLGRAFEDDPLFRWILPDDGAQVQRLSRYFDAVLRAIYVERPDPWTTTDLGGAALWMPPGAWRPRLLSQLRAAPGAIRAVGSGVLRGARALHAIEERHLRVPHHYLAVLAVAPEKQGQGLGRALLEPVLSRCDRDGLPAYLETAKEANLGFYRRCGFELTETVQLPGAPPIWLMRRPPRSRT